MSAEGEAEALIVLSEPGRIEVRNWLPHGPQILEMHEELKAKSDEVSREQIRELQDRYGRLPITASGRPYLGDAILTHLGAPLETGIKTVVYVVVYPDRIDILSEAYRKEAHRSSTLLTADLP